MEPPAFVELSLELLSCLGTVRARRMFGGWGLYADDVFVALVADDRLYLKAGAQTASRFEVAGCHPFTFQAQGRAMTLGYWSAPAEAMDSPALMEPWARLALQAALQARKAPARRRRKA